MQSIIFLQIMYKAHLTSEFHFIDSQFEKATDNNPLKPLPDGKLIRLWTQQDIGGVAIFMPK